MQKETNNNEKWATLITEAKAAGVSKNTLLAESKFEDAYEISRSFQPSDPRRGEIAYYLAYARFVNKKGILAIALFEESLEFMLKTPSQAKQCTMIYSIIGAIYYDLGDFEKAEQHIRNSLDLEDRYSFSSQENPQLLISILMGQNRYLEAIPYLEKQVVSFQDNDTVAKKQILQLLCFAHHELGNSEEELKWKKEILVANEASQNGTQVDAIEIPEIAPAGWGYDRITHFIETSRQIEFATFDRNRADFKRLLEINERFWTGRRNLALHLADIIQNNHKGKSFDSICFEEAELLELFFFLRAHASFLGAVRLCLSAQAPESFALLRCCLENAQYCFYVSTDPILKQIWLNRHASKEAFKLVRNKFSNSKIEAALKQRDSGLGQTVCDLYNVTIDFGAHPNVKTFMANAFQTNSNGQIIFAVTYLNSGQIDQVTARTIEVGHTALSVFKHVFPNLVE